MTSQPEVHILADAAAVQTLAAGRIVALARERVALVNRFTIALAGGSTPRGLYQRLASEPWRSQMPWTHTYIIWGDERYVPPDDPDSNYRMVRETLLDHVPIPPDQVYPVGTAHADPHEAASAYATQVQALLDQGQGQLDLVLLGMGPDAHTASLFPQHPTLHTPQEILVVAVENAPKPPPRRITLSVGALNRARQVLFLVTGADKGEALRAVLYGPQDPERLPAQLVQPPHGSVVWLVDAATGL